MINKKVVIIDYGLGNIFSINQACNKVGINTIVTSEISLIENADAIILPGVGAFGDAMKNLEQLNLINTIKNFAKSGKPFLGICLGMQLLFSKSEEFGRHIGLGLVEGEIKKFNFNNTEGNLIKIPQIQWNQIYFKNNDSWNITSLSGIRNNSYMYFVHSYYAKPQDENIILSYTKYADFEYCSAIKKGNITGLQFHPEKSGEIGINIFKNWLIKNI
jgi:glutamine amidotransferase